MSYFNEDENDANFNSFWAETERREAERAATPDDDADEGEDYDADEYDETAAIDIHADLDDEFTSNPEDFDDITEDSETWPEEFRESDSFTATLGDDLEVVVEHDGEVVPMVPQSNAAVNAFVHQATAHLSDRIEEATDRATAEGNQEGATILQFAPATQRIRQILEATAPGQPVTAAELIEAGTNETAPQAPARRRRATVRDLMDPTQGMSQEAISQAVQSVGFSPEIAEGVAQLSANAPAGFEVPETIEFSDGTTAVLDAPYDEMFAREDSEAAEARATLPDGISEEPPAESQPAGNPAEDAAAMARLERWINGETEPPTPEQQQFITLTRDLQQATMIFQLTVRGISFRARVKDNEDIYEENVKQAAEAEMITSNKKLLDCPELRAIRNCKKVFVKWLKFRLLECSILKGGMFLIPLTNVKRVQAEYELFRVARYRKVLELIRVYPQRRAECMAKLNQKKVLVKESDYPTVKQIVDAFTVEKAWVPFDAPMALKAISEQLWQEETANLQIKLASVGEDSLSKLKEGLQHYVDWLVTSLTTTQANGKKRAIATDKMADMRTFLQEVKNLNITNNAELDELADKARAAIEGVEAETLKQDDTRRATVLEQFQALQATTSQWIINVENNQLVMDEDDV